VKRGVSVVENGEEKEKRTVANVEALRRKKLEVRTVAPRLESGRPSAVDEQDSTVLPLTVTFRAGESGGVGRAGEGVNAVVAVATTTAETGASFKGVHGLSVRDGSASTVE
jgi:hypothetical protein